MSFNLAGKKYLVTGAGRGIGRMLCKTLCEQGCKVYALSRTQETLDSLKRENKNINIVQVDLSNWDELKDKLDDIEVLDGLVNNAALTGNISASALDVSKESLNKTFDTNLFAPINATQIIGQKMIAAKRPGSIVNVSSILSIQSVPQYLAYSASKAALDMVTKQFALELGPYNIRVNSINTNLVNTENLQHLIKSGYPLDKFYIDKTPMGRLLEIKEVVNPILYLLSDVSSMVSGTTHIVDGAAMSSFLTKF